MFAKALMIANHFTWPMIIAYRTLGGECSCAIGAITIINEEGWFVTAGHNISMFNATAKEVERTNLRAKHIAAIRAKLDLNDDEKEKLIHQIPPNTEKSKDLWGVWCGDREVELTSLSYGERLIVVGFGDAFDIGVGKIKDFDPKWVSRYPIFKDHNKNIKTGTSLCKQGFPFHKLKVDFDHQKGTFVLPDDNFPLAYFPIEGMLTRILKHRDANGGPEPFRYPIMQIEISTPGLKGQSGGPIVDVNGTVWSIQSRTLSVPIGFDGHIPGHEPVPQFLNVGIGTHPSTIFGFLKDHKIDFRVSDY